VTILNAAAKPLAAPAGVLAITQIMKARQKTIGAPNTHGSIFFFSLL
jgi:hypothetical protein